jgi:hypothetical protein
VCFGRGGDVDFAELARDEAILKIELILALVAGVVLRVGLLVRYSKSTLKGALKRSFHA